MGRSGEELSGNVLPSTAVSLLLGQRGCRESLRQTALRDGVRGGGPEAGAQKARM